MRSLLEIASTAEDYAESEHKEGLHLLPLRFSSPVIEKRYREFALKSDLKRVRFHTKIVLGAGLLYMFVDYFITYDYSLTHFLRVALWRLCAILLGVGFLVWLRYCSVEDQLLYRTNYNWINVVWVQLLFWSGERVMEIFNNVDSHRCFHLVPDFWWSVFLLLSSTVRISSFWSTVIVNQVSILFMMGVSAMMNYLYVGECHPRIPPIMFFVSTTSVNVSGCLTLLVQEVQYRQIFALRHGITLVPEALLDVASLFGMFPVSASRAIAVLRFDRDLLLPEPASSAHMGVVQAASHHCGRTGLGMVKSISSMRSRSVRNMVHDPEKMLGAEDEEIVKSAELRMESERDGLKRNRPTHLCIEQSKADRKHSLLRPEPLSPNVTRNLRFLPNGNMCASTERVFRSQNIGSALSVDKSSPDSENTRRSRLLDLFHDPNKTRRRLVRAICNLDALGAFARIGVVTVLQEQLLLVSSFHTEGVNPHMPLIRVSLPVVACVFGMATSVAFPVELYVRQYCHALSYMLIAATYGFFAITLKEIGDETYTLYEGALSYILFQVASCGKLTLSLYMMVHAGCIAGALSAVFVYDSNLTSQTLFSLIVVWPMTAYFAHLTIAQAYAFLFLSSAVQRQAMRTRRISLKRGTNTATPTTQS